MNMYLIVYEIEQKPDWLVVAYDGHLDTDTAYKIAIEQANDVWGVDDDGYAVDDIEELTCQEIASVGTRDGKRQFAVNLEELEA